MPNPSVTKTDFSALLAHHRWPWHLGFWLLYGLSRILPYYLTVVYYDVRLLYFMLGQEVLFVALVYGTVGLYRRFFAVGQVRQYLLFGLPLWLGYVAFFAWSLLATVGDLSDFKDSTWGSVALNNATKFFFIFALLTMAKYFKDNFIRQYYDNQRKQLQLASELENLKAQVSPHFLFNTMNNFYGLAVVRSEKLPGLMVRLSELLRYSLYETSQPTVPLAKDVANLEGYVELEKIRLEDNLEFEWISNIGPDCRAQIAPLLLVVFVENAFKHAKKTQNQPVRIRIELHLSDDHTFTLQVTNNCLDHPSPPEPGGIGLENVKKRLNVLYPNGLHKLQLHQTTGEFRAHLTLQLPLYAA